MRGPSVSMSKVGTEGETEGGTALSSVASAPPPRCYHQFIATEANKAGKHEWGDTSGF